jgi:hypothetical protein
MKHVQTVFQSCFDRRLSVDEQERVNEGVTCSHVWPSTFVSPEATVSFTAFVKSVWRRADVSRVCAERDFLDLEANAFLLAFVAEVFVCGSIDSLVVLATVVYDFAASAATELAHLATEVASYDKGIGHVETDTVAGGGVTWPCIVAI